MRSIYLSDFETDLKSYEVSIVPDSPDSTDYISKEKGIQITTTTEGNYIQSIGFFPTSEETKKLKCSNKCEGK